VIGHDKILAEHRARRAFVYARQSTPAQVIQHRSSTERQLGLAGRAAELGWSDAQIEIVDEDLGHSGRYTEGREGFQRLAAEMTMGRVGAVLSLDASRLARSSADWHRLLEIAALTRTLLIDEQSVYDPRDPNDRLVLGMKGTMADFELVWLRQRMDGGRWHLARQGAFRMRPPAGYVYEDDEATSLALDPDEEIRRAVELLFERYRVAGTNLDVVEYFASRGLRFPSRYGKTVRWVRLNSSRVNAVLTNPIYAGVYVYGRSRGEMILDEGRRRRRVTSLPIADWKVSIQNAHPAYISWEEYMTNRKRISDNAARRRGGTNSGAVREGRALLQGLLLCGRCGARISVRYSGQNGRCTNYSCTRLRFEALTSNHCLHVSARQLETPIIDVVMKRSHTSGCSTPRRSSTRSRNRTVHSTSSGSFGSSVLVTRRSERNDSTTHANPRIASSRARSRNDGTTSSPPSKNSSRSMRPSRPRTGVSSAISIADASSNSLTISLGCGMRRRRATAIASCFSAT
jgi:DNA invertase Pin-like site-specific DNA recombinase